MLLNINKPKINKTGSLFISENNLVDRVTREKNILSAFLDGCVPDFLLNLKEINISDNKNNITYYVMPDYLSIGIDTDYIRLPMNPLTAQKIADLYNCTLPTKKMVYDIWKQSINKLIPLSWGPPYDTSMLSTYRYKAHNDKIQKQLKDNNYKELTSGHKKDVVLTNKLSPNNPKKKVAIYGWIQSNGKPIQGLNYFSHEQTYADYSHGIRLIYNTVTINNKEMNIIDVFTDPKLNYLLSDEGQLTFLRY